MTLGAGAHLQSREAVLVGWLQLSLLCCLACPVISTHTLDLCEYDEYLELISHELLVATCQSLDL